MALAWLVLGVVATPNLHATAAAGHADLQPYRAEILNPDFYHAGLSPRSGTTLVVGSEGTIWRRPTGVGSFESTEAGVAARDHGHLHRVAFDADGGVAIAVGTDGLLLRSTDDGRSWTRIELPAQTFLREVLPLPRPGAWLVAGGQGQVLRSDDGGLSWSLASVGPEVQLNRLLRSADGRIWAVGELSLIAVSDDEGRSWAVRRLRRDGPPIVGLYESPGLLLAAAGDGIILRSDDGGQRWLEVQTPSGGFTEAILHDPRHGSWVALTHQGDSLWSRDGGRRWQRAGKAFGTGLAAMHLDAERGQIVAVGQAGVVQVSTNGGRSWQVQRLPREPELLGMRAGADGYLAWGRWGALYEGDASGRQWRMLREPQTDPVSALLRVPASGALLAAGLAGWMSRSEDGGHSWNKVPMKFVVDMYPTDFRALAALPDGRSLLATGPTGSIMRSEDEGRHWRSVLHRPFETGELPVTLVPTRGGAWLVPEMTGPVYRSSDEGRTWARLKPPPRWPAKAVTRTGLASPFDGSLLLVGNSTLARRSVDEGASWRTVALGGHYNLFAMWADAGSPRWWLAGTEGVLLHSADGGLNWRRLPIAGEPAVKSTLFNFAELSRGDAHRLLVVGRDGVIAISDDGEHWRRVASGTDEDLMLVLNDPDRGHTFVLGRHGTVLRSSDAGRSWSRLFSPTRDHLRAAVLLPDGSLVAAGERLIRLVPRAR